MKKKQVPKKTLRDKGVRMNEEIPTNTLQLLLWLELKGIAKWPKK
jgi:hypothetical protein